MTMDMTAEAAERDRIIGELTQKRSHLVTVAKQVADQLAAVGTVTSIQVRDRMREMGYGPAMDAVDPRWIGALFRVGWYRVGYVPEGSHCRPVAVWSRSKP